MTTTTAQPTYTYEDILRLFAETDRKMQENAQQMKEMDERLNKKIGALGNRLGDFVQEMLRPAVVELFQTLGIAVHEVYPNIGVNRNGGMEVDLFVVDDSQAIAIRPARSAPPPTPRRACALSNN
uniref:Uncharacterized protein n=1 Tax=Candidatus Kentrum sp. FW TaxID=2126338 RepID=A0A450SV67_9GAMM|nr:MAG: Protein of unknown function (DUF3782) [Candidatus Kentron sp. FW]